MSVNVWAIAQDTTIKHTSDKVTVQILTNAAYSAVPNTGTPGTGDSLQWSNVSTSPVQMQIDKGYYIDSLSLVNLSLPATVQQGSKIAIYGFAGGWRLSQSAGQQIIVGNKTTTLGEQGAIAGTEQGDFIELTYVNKWICTRIHGNLEVF